MGGACYVKPLRGGCAGVSLLTLRLHYQSWLDSESTYRLTVEKSKEATEGATFARNEYEKWEDANKAAKKDLEDTLARHAIERKSIEDERALIKMIMRLIGEHTGFFPPVLCVDVFGQREPSYSLDKPFGA